jgi:hypothetical protein
MGRTVIKAIGQATVVDKHKGAKTVVAERKMGAWDVKRRAGWDNGGGGS